MGTFASALHWYNAEGKSVMMVDRLIDNIPSDFKLISITEMDKQKLNIASIQDINRSDNQ